jgi:molecular chaperone GrpE
MNNDSQTDWKNKYIRLLADFDNHRKREVKMQALAIDDAKQDLLEEFIRILDEMRLTLIHCDNSSAMNGFKIIVSKMERLLKDEGYERVSPECGDKFDPTIHNAMCLIETDPSLVGCIVECIRDGWVKNGNPLRAADVKVGTEV